MIEQWKVLRPPREAERVVAALTLVALAVGALAFGACAPAERAAGPRAVLAEGAVGSARVITVVHVMQPGAVVASVGYADTSTASVLATDGSAAIDLAALVGKPHAPNADDVRLYSVAKSAGGGLEIARDARRPLRQGRWVRDVRLADGRQATVAFSAANGAPVSAVTVRIGDQVVLTEQREWRLVDGVWQLGSRTLTAFRDGRATGWAELTVEAAPMRTASAAARAVNGASSVVRASALAVADVLTPASLQAQAMSGPCGTQANTALDALKDYESAVVVFGAAALSGNPFATFAAAVNLVRSSSKVDDTQARLDQCVDAA